jgi:hypothetical protein
MKDNQVIRNSVSPFNFPLVVVKKKNFDDEDKPILRVCVDFRKLNEITEYEAYGLPNLIEIFDSLGSSKYLSILDLVSGYHQIKIDERDTHKTAFSSKSGNYGFLRMSFGISSARVTFTRAIRVVYGYTLRDHQERLKHVFQRLRFHNL